MFFELNRTRNFPGMNSCGTTKHINCHANHLSELNITILDGGHRKVITFGSSAPRSFHGGPVAAACLDASSGAAERPSCRSVEARATAPGRGDCNRSRGHAATPPTRVGKRRGGRSGDPPGRRILVWERGGEEEAGVEMSRSMGVGREG